MIQIMSLQQQILYKMFANLTIYQREATWLARNTLKVMSTHSYATKAEKKRGIDRRPIPKVEHTMQSIATKGFLRPTQDYTPPANYKDILQSVCAKHLQSHSEETLLGDKKADILMDAATELSFAVPNSLLHQVIAVCDLTTFYGMETSSKTPLDKMRNMELPENLHMQFDYHRWHPDTDTKFGGVTAFPESSTLVTGLKYRNKYKGHRQVIKVPRE